MTMDAIPTIDTEPIRDTYGVVKERLRRYVSVLANRGELRLPSEDQLSERMGVSRPTIRSALLSLQKEGRIQRFHGKATLINLHAAQVRANVAEDIPFLELLERLGYEADVQTISQRVEPTDDTDAATLGVRAGTACLIVERLFRGSARPAVLSIDQLPLTFMIDPDDIQVGASTFELVDRTTDRHIRYSVAELIPIIADGIVSDRLGIVAGSPLLLLRHVHIDEHEHPVAITTAYVTDELVRFSVIRTYTDT